MTDKENIYAAPKADLSVEPADVPLKPGIGKRFLLTAACAFPLFLLSGLFVPRTQWFPLTVGALMIAVLAGLVAMCIPVRSKPLFIVPSLVFCLAVTVYFGSRAA